ncbi:MAG: hypothetical protein ACXWKY_14735 [Caulobacteraceae bacterium]
MNAQSWRAGRKFACGALVLGLILNGPMLVVAAQAQNAIVDPNAAGANASARDAALAAARKGDYISALDLSKKAAAAGQPLEADQVDFISGKAAQQEAAGAEAAKVKAAQEAAAAKAQEILARQQKDYAARSKQQQEASGCGQPTHIGTFTSAAGAAASQGNDSLGGKRVTGAGGCPG